MLRDHCTELIVCSHLRWDWVWQRPQHLISRLGRDVRTFYVEEPMASGGGESELHWRRDDDRNVTRMWLDVPGPERWIGFGDPAAADYPEMLAGKIERSGRRILWLYTAMAVPFIDALEPDLVVSDGDDPRLDLHPGPSQLPQRRADDEVAAGTHAACKA